MNEPLAQLYLLFAARAGDVTAQMTLGYKYLHGHGTPKLCNSVQFFAIIAMATYDTLQAAEWYELAAAEAVNQVEEGLGSVFEQVNTFSSILYHFFFAPFTFSRLIYIFV